MSNDELHRMVATDAERMLADWLGKARYVRGLADDEPWPAWSTGEVLAVALILNDTATLDDLGYSVDEALERLRFDIREPTRAAAAARFDRLRELLAEAGPPAPAAATGPGGVTPAQLRELAGRAAQLVDEIEAARAALAGDNNTRRTGYRLADAAGWARQVGTDLTATAEDLARVRSRGPATCPAEWGCCPDHGGTLRSSGGRCWCTHPGCGRTWDYDRDGQPCTEPAAYEVRGVGDAPDVWGLLCAGHTLTARSQVDGIEVRPLAAAAGGAR